MNPTPPAPVSWITRVFVGLLLLAALGGLGYWLYATKTAHDAEAAAAAAAMPEPMEVVQAVQPEPFQWTRRTSTIGTVLALRSVTLRNELPGTVKSVHLPAGAFVEEGDLLVQLDVAVEQAELAAQKAEAALAESLLARLTRAEKGQAASAADVDRARAERDVALATVARTEAVIAQKTMRAPFKARIGLSNVHEGQYLAQGSWIASLQSVADAVHVDFRVPQEVAQQLAPGTEVEAHLPKQATAIAATVVAIDAEVDPSTRNQMVRARIESEGTPPAPGSSVRIAVPVGAPRELLAIPATALRRTPSGNFVFLIQEDPTGTPRAAQRAVQVVTTLGDKVLIAPSAKPEEGLELESKLAAVGSFKLFNGMKVFVAPPAARGQE